MNEIDTASRYDARTQDMMDIRDTISAVSLFADLGQFDDASAMFTSDAVLDYSSMAIMGGEQARALNAQEFWKSVQTFFPGFDATQHMITNFVITVDGDTATSISTVRALHRVGQALWINGGHYHHTLVRVGDGWRIKHLRYEIRYEEGEPLVEQAKARMTA